MDHPWCDPYRGFCWPLYLEHTRSRAAPLSAFRECFPAKTERTFQEGMKLEAIDPEHQAQICLVTVAEVKGRTGRLFVVQNYRYSILMPTCLL